MSRQGIRISHLLAISSRRPTVFARIYEPPQFLDPSTLLSRSYTTPNRPSPTSPPSPPSSPLPSPGSSSDRPLTPAEAHVPNLSTLTPVSGRFKMYQRYAPALHSLSERTGTPLPSLFVSFLILHELTAFLPLLITFYIFNALGAGVAFVAWLTDITGQQDGDKDRGEQGQGRGREGWTMAGKVREWYDEAEKRVEKVGQRYGILGYEKVSKEDRNKHKDEDEDRKEAGSRGTKAVGSVADAIAAYVVIKALLPLRIGASLWLAPGFARFALNPIQHLVRRLRRK